MRDAVRQAFQAYTERFEGAVRWMYLDVRGLCTTAIGNLIDPIETALGLPFVRPDGMPATRDEIATEWRRVKALQSMAKLGGYAFRNVTTLRLTPAGVVDIVDAKLDAVDKQLAARFSGYKDWPADAQLGTLSLAWACGAAFRFTRFEAAVSALDFDTAARESQMDATGNPGLRPRNAAQLVLFSNAARVLAGGDYSPETLYWPEALPVEPPPPTEDDQLPGGDDPSGQAA